MLQSHERPTRIAFRVLVILSPPTKDTLDAIWTDQVNFNVSSPRVIDPNFDINVLQLLKVVFLHHVGADLHRAT